tara:strand:+ start:1418 stop:3490 length:2073 start_codon:yes stop_codon:yes gene_type:complete
MTVAISYFAGAGWQFFDNNGIPLAGGLIYTYAAGTTTPQATYTTSAGSIANANPIVLDSAGRVPNEVWMTSGLTYKFVLKTSVGVQIGSYDNIPAANDTAYVFATLAASSGSSLVGFLQAGTGAVATTVQTKLREMVSVKDFGAKGDGSTDDTAAFRAAIQTNKPVFVPFGTYCINSPVITEAEVTAGTYGTSVSLIGQSPVHTGAAGNGRVEIDLTSNTQYFSAFGYSPFISNISFDNGVDVIHYSTQGLDCSIVELNSVRAFGFTGTFFKGFGSGNGTHITWNDPVILSNFSTAIVFDDTMFGGSPLQGFDALAIHDGWIETQSAIGFKIATGNFSVSDTRFIPYTSVGSYWFSHSGEGSFSLYNCDFGGESGRKILQWNESGGSISLNNCGIYSTASLIAINLVAAPVSISLNNVNSDSNPASMIDVDGGMTTANYELLSCTEFHVDQQFKYTLNNLANYANAAASAVVAKDYAPYHNAAVLTSDCVASGGSTWVSASGGAGFTSVTGASAPDLYGANAYGFKFTSTSSASGYLYMNSSPGLSTLAEGSYTYELVATVTAGAGAVQVTMYFGEEVTGRPASKVFWIGPGTHHLCFPFIYRTSMVANLGIGFQMFTGATLSVTRVKVFSNNYNTRNFNMYATAAPTGVTIAWERGDRVINSAPVVGQPKSWVCTVAGAPGTWVSEGNL